MSTPGSAASWSTTRRRCDQDGTAASSAAVIWSTRRVGSAAVTMSAASRARAAFSHCGQGSSRAAFQEGRWCRPVRHRAGLEPGAVGRRPIAGQRSDCRAMRARVGRSPRPAAPSARPPAALRLGVASATGSISSTLLQPRMSHSAISVRRFSRSGVWVTSR